MKKKIQSIFKSNGIMAVLSFVLPIVLMGAVYLSIGIYPGSERSVMASDSFTQLSNFFASYNTAVKGNESIFYTWYASFGLNYWTFISYYLGGIFTPLILLFNNQQIPDALYILTLFKIGCSGTAFYFFSSQTFKIPKWGHLLFSISYAMMSFTIAFSEMLMWLDTFIYLPLVILGIHRLMDQRKPSLLFISYFLLFITNFYMAFIVGFFSFLYYFVRLFTNKAEYGRTFFSYLLTSLLAGGASMVVILPTIIDLKNNGEALTTLEELNTQGTGSFDMIIKSFVGVYDTTMTNGTPFVFVGLWSLLLCLYYFTTKKVSVRDKICYGLLFVFVILSFYFEPFNLFWQGMHAPNMFPFRYSFVLSFLILLVAGYAWEKVDSSTFDSFLNVAISLIVVFTLAKVVTSYEEAYYYLTIISFVVTLALIFLYLGYVYMIKKGHSSMLWLGIFMVLAVSSESFFNAHQIVHGISKEWTYSNKSKYTGPYPHIKELVDSTKKTNSSFYRIESLDPVTKNDSLTYGYSSVSMFSSMRNRHSLSYLHDLGYRSWGTNLQISYANNTILMDTISGVKYNLAKDDPMKFGFHKVGDSGEFTLYENEYAMPMGVMTNDRLYEEGVVKSQTSLFNQLSDKEENYFSFIKPTILSKENVEIETEGEKVRYSEELKDEKKPKQIKWGANIPAGYQAYFSLNPINYKEIATATTTLTVNGISRTTKINSTGQYYNLGYFEKDTEIEFSTSFSGSQAVEFFEPDIVLLDSQAFEKAARAIQNKGVDFNVIGRKASTIVDLEEAGVLFTTIPYDKGWKAYVDGVKVEIPRFKEAFLTVPLAVGEHEVEFVFLPAGLLTGAGVTCFSFVGFSVYLYLLKRRGKDPFYNKQ